MAPQSLEPEEPDSGMHPLDSGTSFVIGALAGGLAGKRIRLADLVEKTLDAVLFLDQASIVRYWNFGAERLFQYRREEILGRDVELILPPDLQQAGELEQLKEACDRDGVVHNHLTRRVRKDGGQVWVSLTRTVLHDEDGEPIGAVATLRDISEQRSKDKKLRRSEELAMVGELAAKIAHEVKNPLAGIFAALQVLEGDLEASDPKREIFSSIGDEVMRLNDITQNLLGFARPTDPEPVRGDLRVFLADLVLDLERIGMVTPGKIELALPACLPARFDSDLTAAVFKNLILNAVQVTKATDSVTLHSSLSPSWVAIDVTDPGPGVPADQRKRIFDPFFTTKARGTGLGLAIARKNMEAQEGRIRLRSHGGRGTSFRVEFPRG